MIKTRRGVYLDLSKSPYIYENYRFSSLKKLEMFKKRIKERQIILSKVYGKLYRINGNNLDFSLQDLMDKVAEIVYNEMQYH